MRLGMIESAGTPHLSLVDGDRFVPVGAVNREAPADMADFLAWLTEHGTTWADFCAAAASAPWQPMAGTRYAPPLSAKSRIFCVGKNYADHAKEMGMATDGPVAPDIFIRFPSSFVGHEGTIEYPAGESSFDFEGELTVVIGKPGAQIDEAQALDHVFGYTATNDGSLRRIQKRTSQFTLGKNVDRSGAMGPTIVPAGEIPEPQALTLKTLVEGEMMQNGTTADMTFPIATVIAVLSSVTELQPGDIILTGTPAGVGAGRKPPRFLEAGETVEVQIEGLDSLSMTVAMRANGVR
ncbi:fumarylacetoacetate hydrolase family protein [Kordiimonas marina]|uniref:fumarylacetoacetate hydrolase family protein n=1 Tax=Kordiimonas marina TaxID=2872312 RepID=UPI001FF4CC9D|nr:fumarylacetoacetate hydrolase family protein [Kordiimonas marina]MCJ9428443.1 fumarylacetoacetate hydrolase family protein [Kordiimonas marina]